MTHENLILKLPNDKELIFRFDEWNKYYSTYVYYEYNGSKMCHKDYGVNAIVNQIAKQFPNDDYSAYLENSWLTINLYRW